MSTVFIVYVVHTNTNVKSHSLHGLHRVSKKLCKLIFCQNFVKF